VRTHRVVGSRAYAHFTSAPPSRIAANGWHGRRRNNWTTGRRASGSLKITGSNARLFARTAATLLHRRRAAGAAFDRDGAATDFLNMTFSASGAVFSTCGSVAQLYVSNALFAPRMVRAPSTKAELLFSLRACACAPPPRRQRSPPGSIAAGVTTLIALATRSRRGSNRRGAHHIRLRQHIA